MKLGITYKWKAISCCNPPEPCGWRFLKLRPPGCLTATSAREAVSCAPNATVCAQLKGRSGKKSNCSELPAGSSAASLRWMQTIWKVFATQGCSRADSGVGAWGQTANAITGAAGWCCREPSWLNPGKERAQKRLHLQQSSKRYSTYPCCRLWKAYILFTQETRL